MSNSSSFFNESSIKGLNWWMGVSKQDWRNDGVWKMLNLSSSCIFSVVTGDWCVCNCDTWAHLVRIWRHSQNSTCQFLFHRQATRMTDPPSPMWSHIEHMVTITLQSTLWLICFGEMRPLVLWSQMATSLLIGSFSAFQNMQELHSDLAKPGLLKYNTSVRLRCLSP